MSQSTHHLIDSLNPAQSAVVYSSAGSGKTWLLIARILRLLIAGAEPRSILAITFTRKAVGEMRERLQARLQNWAFMTDTQLHQDLRTVGLTKATAKTFTHARGLYEHIVLHDNPVYITTFHAFCHDIQKRFPLESALPIGFSLTEQTGPLLSQAVQRLYQRTEKEPELRSALEVLFEFCDGPRGTEVALKNFWLIRNEWKLFSHLQKDPPGYALEQLHSLYKDGPTFKDDAKAQLLALLKEYLQLLQVSDTATHQKSVQQISDFLTDACEHPFRLAKCFLYAGKLERKPLKPSKKLIAKIGSASAEKLVALHNLIGEHIIHAREQSLRGDLIRANRAWWHAGNALLQSYQELKYAQGVADFDDLEFETYQLMQSQEHAGWLQYKLGSKLQHFLVDEFQDTNTFQWKLLQPLILAAKEIAASTAESSVFLVGDIKQSIYRFRRANPAIMQSALAWCNQHFPCDEYSNNISWRSGPAVIDFINQAFNATPLKNKLSNFQKHRCQQPGLWSKVEIHPLFCNEDDTQSSHMRNPLQEPRHPFVFSNRYREGVYIAHRIRELVNGGCSIIRDNQQTAITYKDILILTRNRTHLIEYEQALRDHGIPFASNDSGYWLQRIEIRDLRCLLALLDSPFDDLLLAQVLRSPIFGTSSNELLALTRQGEESLFETLDKQANLSPPLCQAYAKICEWGTLANRIPVQDLLDKIYFEWDLIERYQSIARPEERPVLHHYLNQFITLTLNIDSGRYPNIQGFLSAVAMLEHELVDQYQDADSQQVRLLTIHGAKGLEAPVVFLADTGPAAKPATQLPTIVDWPQDKERPSLVVLTKNNPSLDQKLRAVKNRIQQPDEEEDYNLLYVAITRARQLLIVTGSSTARNTSSWHQLLLHSVSDPADPHQVWEFEKGEPAKSPIRQRGNRPVEIVKIPTTLRTADTIESKSKPEIINPADAYAGIFLHKCLELLSENPKFSVQSIINTLILENSITIPIENAEVLYQEALRCINHSHCKTLFCLPSDAVARNEVSIVNASTVLSTVNIIDRLIIYPESIWIVDYKSQRIDKNSDLQNLAEQHRAQLSRYRTAVQQSYPDRRIRCSILFTKIPRIVDL